MVAPTPTVDPAALNTADAPAVGLDGVTVNNATGSAGAPTTNDLLIELLVPPGPDTVNVTV